MSSMAGVETQHERAILDLGRGSLPKIIKVLDRETKNLPTEQDFHFFSNFVEFKAPIIQLRSRVASLLNQLGSLEEVVTHPHPFPSQLEEGYDWLVGVQDDLLERADASLDRFYTEKKDQMRQNHELSAVETASKRLLSARNSQASSVVEDKSGGVKVAKGKDTVLRSPVPFHIPSIPRPQDKFDEKVDNSNTPFQHKGRKGGYEQESEASTADATGQGSGDLSHALTMSVLEQHARRLGVQGSLQNSHPLEEELKNMNFLEPLSDSFEIRKYNSLEETPFSLVTTVKELREMADKLRRAGEIAVDLENHHYRSYQGFVCLMQISTREEDFLIDTLDLRSQIGPCLGDIFSDPTIKKVMHGANSDIVWLQRDFGVYVCHLFDTGQAARVLQLQGFGLAFLLEHYCGVHPDKRYQLADWRIRPLPLEMTRYAREDTHYLLFVYDVLRKDLLKARLAAKGDENDPLLEVYKRSRDICLQLYTKEIFTETSYKHIYGLQEKKFRPEQLAALAGLYAWRDQISRREDESTGYVMPNHLLLQLASEMPSSMRQLQNILKLAKGSYSLVSLHGGVILEIIRQNRERALKESGESSECRSGTVVELATGKVGSQSTRLEEILPLKVAIEGSQSEGEEGHTVVPGPSQEDCVNPILAASMSLSTPVAGGTVLEMTRVDQPVQLMGVAANSTPSSYLLKQESYTSPGPAVVSGRTGSSFFSGKSKKVSPAPLPPLAPSSPLSSPPDFGKVITEQSPPEPLPLIPVSAPVSSALAIFPAGNALREGHVADGRDCREDKSVTVEGMQSGLYEAEVPHIGISPDGDNLLSGDVRSNGSSDLPRSNGPESSLVEGATGPSEGDFELASTSGYTAPFPDESVAPNETAPVLEPRRSFSKLGALLGGRKKQSGTSVFLGDLEKAKMARIQAQEIETSMILPFNFRDKTVFEKSAQLQIKGDAHVNANEHGENVSKLDDQAFAEQEVDGLAKDAMISKHEARSSISLGSPAEEIIMLDEEGDPDADADAHSGRTDRTGDMASSSHRQASEGSLKHRPWWPNVSGDQGVSQTRSSDSTHDLAANEDVADKKPQLPPSLAEMCSSSRRGKKRKKRNQTFASRVNPEGNRSDERAGEHHVDIRKGFAKRHLASDNVSGDKRLMDNHREARLRNFDYTEARNILGLDNFYAGGPHKKQESRGRETSRRHKYERRTGNHSAILASEPAFDPLRRVREEPRPEGIPAGPRRQVFPQSGNRTVTFK